MKFRKRSSGCLPWLLVNMLLNLGGSIPAWVLLALHFLLGISLWWFAAALGAWLLYLLLGMWFVGWAARCGNIKDPPKENKNPYSVRNTNTLKGNEPKGD